VSSRAARNLLSNFFAPHSQTLYGASKAFPGGPNETLSRSLTLRSVMVLYVGRNSKRPEFTLKLPTAASARQEEHPATQGKT
jgi:hypothetical protein